MQGPLWVIRYTNAMSALRPLFPDSDRLADALTLRKSAIVRPIQIRAKTRGACHRAALYADRWRFCPAITNRYQLRGAETGGGPSPTGCFGFSVPA